MPADEPDGGREDRSAEPNEEQGFHELEVPETRVRLVLHVVPEPVIGHVLVDRGDPGPEPLQDRCPLGGCELVSGAVDPALGEHPVRCSATATELRSGSRTRSSGC